MGGPGEISEGGAARDHADVRALELRLLDPGVRRDRAAVERLLHPDFDALAASGRVWDRPSIVAALAAEPGGRVDVSELAASTLGADVVLVTYRAVQPGGPASLRASVWVRADQGWRVRYHQGTPAEPAGT